MKVSICCFEFSFKPDKVKFEILEIRQIRSLTESHLLHVFDDLSLIKL